MGAPLSDGVLKDGKLRCPWHGYDFDAADGRLVHNPNDRVFGCMKHLYQSYDPAKTPQYRLKHLHCEVVADVLRISTDAAATTAEVTP
jgi:nitrite reductase/ring-hydroxylating ferredoxin subunit